MWRSIKYKGHELISSLLSVIYPTTCPVCKNASDSISHAPICKNCWNTIKPYKGPSCSICAAPLVSEYSITCGGCLKQRPYFSMVLNFGIYSGALSQAIHLLKFSGLRRLAGPLGKLPAGLPIPEMDGIVPVPVTGKTLKERGFNQTLLLSKSLSRRIKIPVKMEVLFKKKETPPQIGLNAKERISNLKNSFEVGGNVKNLRLLLLDDVMTTGATVRECSKTLIKAGAKEVIVITLARSPLN